MSLALLFHYLLLNMFRMLIHPSSGACDLFVELFYGLYCSGSMCVGVTLWFGWGGVVSRCTYIHIYTYIPSQYRDAGGTQEIKNTGTAVNAAFQGNLSTCRFRHACHRYGSPSYKFPFHIFF